MSEQVVRTAIEGKQIIVTRGEEVLCSPPATRRNKLSPCSHEQVDTRMMVHIPVSHWRGSVSCCDFRPKGIMVSYGTRRKHRILLVHLFAKALGPSKSKCLPHLPCPYRVRHNILLRWENFPDVTRTFLELAGTPSNISEENLCTIKRFVILICDRTSHFSKVGVNLEKNRFLLEKLWSCSVCIYLQLLFGICSRSMMPESTCSPRKRERVGRPSTHSWRSGTTREAHRISRRRIHVGTGNRQQSCSSWTTKLGLDPWKKRAAATTMGYA